MASAAPEPASRPQQQWLDIARPIQPRAPGERPAPSRAARRGDDGLAGRQMELRMTAPAPSQTLPTPPPSPPMAAAPAAAAAAVRKTEAWAAVRIEAERPCFVTWLLGQGKSGGAIGELAKAARLDPLFPKKGGADAVRARFSKAGADGDAYAALDDAERAYDRLG